jgi:hypothetical protein
MSCSTYQLIALTARGFARGEILPSEGTGHNGPSQVVDGQGMWSKVTPERCLHSRGTSTTLRLGVFEEVS